MSACLPNQLTAPTKPAARPPLPLLLPPAAALCPARGSACGAQPLGASLGSGHRWSCTQPRWGPGPVLRLGTLILPPADERLLPRLPGAAGTAAAWGTPVRPPRARGSR